MTVCIETSNCDPEYLPTENVWLSETLLYQNAIRCIYKMHLLSFNLYCVENTKRGRCFHLIRIYRSGWDQYWDRLSEDKAYNTKSWQFHHGLTLNHKECQRR